MSQANQTYGMFECPDTTLANLVLSLPKLTSLDISGTNLSGDGTFDEYRKSDTVKTTALVFLKQSELFYCDGYTRTMCALFQNNIRSVL